MVWRGMGSHGWLVEFSCKTNNGKTIQHQGLDAKKHGMPWWLSPLPIPVHPRTTCFWHTQVARPRPGNGAGRTWLVPAILWLWCSHSMALAGKTDMVYGTGQSLVGCLHGLGLHGLHHLHGPNGLHHLHGLHGLHGLQALGLVSFVLVSWISLAFLAFMAMWFLGRSLQSMEPPWLKLWIQGCPQMAQLAWKPTFLWKTHDPQPGLVQWSTMSQVRRRSGGSSWTAPAGFFMVFMLVHFSAQGRRTCNQPGHLESKAPRSDHKIPKENHWKILT